MATVNMKGPYTYGTNNPVYNVWHSKQPNKSGAVLDATGTFSATRSEGKITISASIKITGKNSGCYFNYPLWFYVKANGETIHTWTSGGNLGISYNGDSWSKTFDAFDYWTNSAVNLSFSVHCAAGTGNGTSESGICDQGYTNVDLVRTDNDSNTLISISAYNPWTDPTNLSGVTNSATTRKPDWDLKVSWNAAKAGTGNSISKYRVQMRRYRGSWSSWTDVNTNVTGTSLTFNPGSIINLRPGDLIATRVAVYVTSNTSGHDSGWLGYVEASNNNVTIYKDGIVYYISSAGGSKTECTMAYYYDSSGNKKKSRYIVVKDSEGTTHIIDMYTTNYE